MEFNFNPEEYSEIIELEGYEPTKVYNYVEMLHDVFKKVMVPAFKEKGFKKRGKTFYRERNGLIEVCNVQFSISNHSVVGSKFTYNIMISSPDFYDSKGIPYKDKLKATIFNFRLGDILEWEMEVDYVYDWYELTDITSEWDKKKVLSSRYNMATGEGFAQVIVEDIDKFVIKFFDILVEKNRLINYMNNSAILRGRKEFPTTFFPWSKEELMEKWSD